MNLETPPNYLETLHKVLMIEKNERIMREK